MNELPTNFRRWCPNCRQWTDFPSPERSGMKYICKCEGYVFMNDGNNRGHFVESDVLKEGE